MSVPNADFASGRVARCPIHFLERYWDTSFRRFIRSDGAILSRRDSVVVLPTAVGKSLFQAPSLCSGLAWLCALTR